MTRTTQGAGTDGAAPAAERRVATRWSTAMATDVAQPEWPTRRGPLVVGFVDAYLAAGVLQVAALLARRQRVSAHVVAMVPPVHQHHEAVLSPEDVEALREGRLLLRRRHVRRQLHRAAGRAVHFSTSTVVGTSERVFASAARERGAECLLVGLDQPGAPARTATEWRLLQLARVSDVPVLGVPRGARALPSRALAAVDGSIGSLRAARAAARLLPPGARLTLVHVVGAADGQGAAQEPVRTLRGTCPARRLAPFASRLQALAGLRVETIWLEGDPAEAILAFAAERDVDLLACGVGEGRSLAWQLGTSVPAALLRATPHAVLLARSPDAAPS